MYQSRIEKNEKGERVLHITMLEPGVDPRKFSQMKEEARADKVVVNNKMEECSICQSPVTIAEKQDLLGMCSCCFDVEMMRYDRIFVIPGDDYISQSAAFRIGVATHKGNLYHYQESVRSNSNWKLYGEYHEDVDCIHPAGS